MTKDKTALLRVLQACQAAAREDGRPWVVGFSAEWGPTTCTDGADEAHLMPVVGDIAMVSGCSADAAHRALWRALDTWEREVQALFS